MAPASGQPMAAVEKDRCEHEGADRVAEQQGEQTGQRRSLRAQAHPPPHPPAQPPNSRLFGQHREARRHSHPADIDQRAERRTVAVERAPLPNQRPGRVRQHADVGHRLALEAHREMAERADRNSYPWPARPPCPAPDHRRKTSVGSAARAPGAAGSRSRKITNRAGPDRRTRPPVPSANRSRMPPASRGTGGDYACLPPRRKRREDVPALVRSANPPG